MGWYLKRLEPDGNDALESKYLLLIVVIGRRRFALICSGGIRVDGRLQDGCQPLMDLLYMHRSGYRQGDGRDTGRMDMRRRRR
jgi:hypothetical protein